jgi:hypothetical protein
MYSYIESNLERFYSAAQVIIAVELLASVSIINSSRIEGTVITKIVDVFPRGV